MNQPLKEARFYTKLEKFNKVRCNLCPHNCLIEVGKVGYCNVKENIKGKLFSLNYNAISIQS
ncbi:MAG: AmmeMemoRadiSam system radical SAM enzyme, partial [Candidatus Ranarchaeia archaeon]